MTEQKTPEEIAALEGNDLVEHLRGVIKDLEEQLKVKDAKLDTMEEKFEEKRLTRIESEKKSKADLSNMVEKCANLNKRMLQFKEMLFESDARCDKLELMYDELKLHHEPQQICVNGQIKLAILEKIFTPDEVRNLSVEALLYFKEIDEKMKQHLLTQGKTI